MTLKLEDLRHDASGCIRCSNCKFTEHIWMQSARFGRQCPISTRYAFNLYSAPGLMHSALGIMDKKLEFTPKLLDALFKCTLCGACDVRCKRNLDPEILSVIEVLKAKAVEVGKGPMPEHRVVTENIEKRNNRYGSPYDNRLKWLTDDIKPAAKADILYFVGCVASYAHNEIAQATARILMRINTDFMVSQDEWCCGYLLYSTGQVDSFSRQAEHNIEMLKKSGAKIVLVSCAEGYKTWKVDYPKVLGKSTDDMDLKVVHIVEYIDQLVKDDALRFKNSIPMKVTYHDPCNLGRLSEPWYHWEGTYKRYGVPEPPKTFRRDGHAGVYESPRDILKAIPGIELIEMERARDNAWCCGAGAGVELAFPDFALWAASERLEEAKATGAEAIVTCCPTCKEVLHKAAQSRREKIKVYDITEIILEAIS
ncbi:MAG: (Fe-S)-binding protein [Dehalococcoidia bacterium]|nr:(Fe-S)-binding protein [Dehalococcoidia bacterium]